MRIASLTFATALLTLASSADAETPRPAGLGSIRRLAEDVVGTKGWPFVAMLAPRDPNADGV